MANFRQKQDQATEVEYRRGCDGLVDGGCAASTAGGGGGGGGDESSDRRRRRSDFEGDDLAESSAAVRRHSRILSRWITRQAEEMITTIERRNRETELMALAGLHTVSMLDSSFLRESSRVDEHPVERPAPARASSVLERWRELERNRNRGNANGPGSGYEERSPATSRENSPEIGDGERERVRSIVRGMMEASRGSSEHESPRAEWLGEPERERVRLVREWVQMASQQQRDGRSGSGRRNEEGQQQQHESMRRDLLRIRGRQARLDLIMRIVRERQRELQGLSEHRAVSDFAHRNRIQTFLRGRFLRNGRPSEDENERPHSLAARELGQLRQRHSVSGLREGFRFRLENIVRDQANNQSETSVRSNVSGSTHEEAQPSSAVELSNENNGQYPLRSEINDNQQMAEEATAELETTTNDNTNWPVSVTQGENWQQANAESEDTDWQQTTNIIGFSEWRNGTGEESDGNWQENIDQGWSRETPEGVDGEDIPILEANEEWHEDDSHDDVDNWQDGPSDPPRDQRPIPNRRGNRFIPPDDDNVYSMELRELLSRRSVSNLLRSGFRESLDQLIMSYVQRQGHAPLNWDLHRPLPSPASPEEEQSPGGDDLTQDEQGIPRPPLVMPSPPVPPPQPLWHSELHNNNWTRQSMHRSEIEWDIVNDLKADMARLQQGMSHMQRMLEACMDMQLELQRSVRQEVSAALNRSVGGNGMGEETSEDGSKWGHVRKGTCCICCDSQIDSLLYRCGHMCTCSKCANELVRGEGKCPLCRAPIVEVIRAYSIL